MPFSASSRPSSRGFTLVELLLVVGVVGVLSSIATVMYAGALDRARIAGKKLYRPKGCVRCRKTGYFGRTGLFELLEVKLPIRKLIFDNKDQDDIRFAAKDAGMVTLRDAGVLKVLAGLTSIAEVARTTVEDD